MGENKNKKLAHLQILETMRRSWAREKGREEKRARMCACERACASERARTPAVLLLPEARVSWPHSLLVNLKHVKGNLKVVRGAATGKVGHGNQSRWGWRTI